MFIGRPLRIALLISFLWHLFWMSFVSIIFLPAGLKTLRYSAVSFLGSILRGPVFIAQGPLSSREDFVELPSEVNVQTGIGNFNERPYMFLPQERKILNPDAFIDVDVTVDSLPSMAGFVSQQGLQTEREIIFRPAFSHYPEWFQEKPGAGSVIFEVYISAEGLVEEVTNVQASGNPEIDAALARYIERWRFTPSAELKGQWQTIEISLDFE